jgi:hypothetical protein
MAYNCDSCSSNRLLSINGKVSDMFSADFKNVDYQGYVPHDLGIGGGDYIELEICLDCGKVQGITKQEDPEFYQEAKESAEEGC